MSKRVWSAVEAEREQRYRDAMRDRRLPPDRIHGLGDVIWWLLRWLPAKWKPMNCQCEKRRAWLNAKVPFR